VANASPAAVSPGLFTDFFVVGVHKCCNCRKLRYSESDHQPEVVPSNLYHLSEHGNSVELPEQ
jgi:hypothetical protein